MLKRLFTSSSKKKAAAEKTPHVIGFFCLEKDKALKIIVEPAAHAFTIHPGGHIRFVPLEPTNDFSWAVRRDENNVLHLHPDITGSFKSIKVWVNEDLVDEIKGF